MKRHFARAVAVPILCTALLSGCSAVKVIVSETPKGSRQPSIVSIDGAANGIRAAQELRRGTDLLATKKDRIAALLSAIRSTKDDVGEAAEINRLATGELVGLLAQGQFADASSAGLALRGESKGTLDPRGADRIIPAQNVAIAGLRNREIQPGIGIPCVAWFAQDSPALRGQPGIINGLAVPATALVEFHNDNPELVFYRTLKENRVRIGGQSVPLAADFSAPLAYYISRGRNKIFDIRAMMRPDLNMRKCALAQLEPYDPDKIPVVFVHGLMCRPEAWVPAMNELLGDKRIRQRYQFWFYLYPTGLPVWASTAKLRMELDRFRAEVDPNHKDRNLGRMVLVGHSMGGLISSLLVRQGGKQLWRQFSDQAPEQLHISPEAKAQLDRLTNFAPREDVARVVFVATPHRGSKLALLPLARFFSSLVRLPAAALMKERRTVLASVRDDMRSALVAPANSIRFLRAKSPLLSAILNLPMRAGVPYHSIIGDRGRGDTPNSSDGVVPYWSSHLEGAVSEKIVPSGHGANENPEAIAEIRRILTSY